IPAAVRLPSFQPGERLFSGASSRPMIVRFGSWKSSHDRKKQRGWLGCRLRPIFAVGMLGSHRGASRAPGEKPFENAANVARRCRFFQAGHLGVASWNDITTTIPRPEYEWDTTGGQNIGDLETHFLDQFDVEDRAVQVVRTCDYIERGFHGPHGA